MLHDHYEAAGVAIAIMTFFLVLCAGATVIIQGLQYRDTRREIAKKAKETKELALTTDSRIEDLMQANEISDGKIKALVLMQEDDRKNFEKEKAELWRHIRAGRCSCESTATPGVGAPVASGTTADTLSTSQSASVAEARGTASGSAGGSTVNRRRPHADARGKTPWRPPGRKTSS